VAWTSRFTIAAILIAATAAVCLPNLRSPWVDDFDVALHWMDGVFFRDLFADLPWRHPIAYTLAYYKQYPALGFVFWPPFFAFVEGLFFTIGGTSLAAARLSVGAFALLLAVCVYRCARLTMPRSVSAAAAVLVLWAAPILDHARMVMLEVPALAMGCLTLYLYARMVRRTPVRWIDALSCAAAAALAIYTKQPIAFILMLPACDVLINHREKLRDRRVWIAAALLAVALIPLAAFTATIGRVRLTEAFGTDKSVVFGTVPPDRWSLAGWLFYVRRLPDFLHPAVLVLGGAALVYGAFDGRFLRRNVLWFAWVVCWWPLFSSFLNKLPRHATFWVIGWVMLACALVAEAQRRSSRLRYAAYAALVVALAAEAHTVTTIRRSGYRGFEPIAHTVVSTAGDGPRAILYFGEYRSGLVPYIRALDPDRRFHVLQGDDILADVPSLVDACRQFRVSTVIVEPTDRASSPALLLHELASDDRFEIVQDVRLETVKPPVRLAIFRYRGPTDGVMRPVRLHSTVVNASID
jgi:hypothetical protein